MDTKPSAAFNTPTSSRPTRPASEEGVPEKEIMLGKMIFYVTVAASLWFFYWLNGVQCPC